MKRTSKVGHHTFLNREKLASFCWLLSCYCCQRLLFCSPSCSCRFFYCWVWSHSLSLGQHCCQCFWCFHWYGCEWQHCHLVLWQTCHQPQSSRYQCLICRCCWHSCWRFHCLICCCCCCWWCWHFHNLIFCCCCWHFHRWFFYCCCWCCGRYFQHFALD